MRSKRNDSGNRRSSARLPHHRLRLPTARSRRSTADRSRILVRLRRFPCSGAICAKRLDIALGRKRSEQQKRFGRNSFIRERFGPALLGSVPNRPSNQNKSEERHWTAWTASFRFGFGSLRKSVLY